jgi:hypothetical protein
MSSSQPDPVGLPGSHHRRISPAVRTLLEAIDDIEAALAIPPAEGGLALFDGDVPAELATPLRSELEGIRARVAELARLADVTLRPVSVRRRVASAASYAWSVAEELTPAKLARFGRFDETAAEAISAAASRLAQDFLRIAREAEGAGLARGDSVGSPGDQTGRHERDG